MPERKRQTNKTRENVLFSVTKRISDTLPELSTKELGGLSSALNTEMNRKYIISVLKGFAATADKEPPPPAQDRR